MSEADGKTWRLAGQVGDMEDDEPRLAAINGHDIALCKVAGQIHAIDWSITERHSTARSRATPICCRIKLRRRS